MIVFSYGINSSWSTKTSIIDRYRIVFFLLLNFYWFKINSRIRHYKKYIDRCIICGRTMFCLGQILRRPLSSLHTKQKKKIKYQNNIENRVLRTPRTFGELLSCIITFIAHFSRHRGVCPGPDGTQSDTVYAIYTGSEQTPNRAVRNNRRGRPTTCRR